jgi:hypothetical protein
MMMHFSSFHFFLADGVQHQGKKRNQGGQRGQRIFKVFIIRMRQQEKVKRNFQFEAQGSGGTQEGTGS